MPIAAIHDTAVRKVSAGHLATCSCGWRSRFPAFAQSIAREQAARHYLASGGSDDDDSRELLADDGHHRGNDLRNGAFDCDHSWGGMHRCVRDAGHRRAHACLCGCSYVFHAGRP